MAKKAKEERSYLQLPLPVGKEYYKISKCSWTGLNMRQTINTGALTMERNISTVEAPYLVPSQEWEETYGKYERPIGMFGFEDFLLVIYREDESIKIDYITEDSDVYTGVIKAEDATEDDEYPRCVVQFNVYDVPTDPVEGKFIKKLLIFPDKKSMSFELENLIKDENITDDTEGDFIVYDMGVDSVVEYYNSKKDENGAYPPTNVDGIDKTRYYKNTYNEEIYKWCEDEDGNYSWLVSIPPAMPDIKYATVHLSRLFGVDDDRVYASGYNDYTNWNLDTVNEYNESNAWCTPAQSNTKAGGNFTGITTFQNHVVCFKYDFMHEIYNTKNPFRIQDIYAEGAIDNRTIQDVDGSLIFVADDAVKVYTGGNPSLLSYYLNIRRFEYAVAGTDGRNYYLYCEDEYGNARMITYDTIVGQWSEQEAAERVLNFAHNKMGMFALCDDGCVYRLDSGIYGDWAFETDLITNENLNIKHIKRIQMLVDMECRSKIDVYFLYDGETFDKKQSHHVCTLTGKGLKTMRIKPRKTAHYGVKVHVEGSGYVKLHEMEIFFEEGGALYG